MVNWTENQQQIYTEQKFQVVTFSIDLPSKVIDREGPFYTVIDGM